MGNIGRMITGLASEIVKEYGLNVGASVLVIKSKFLLLLQQVKTY